MVHRGELCVISLSLLVAMTYGISIASNTEPISMLAMMRTRMTQNDSATPGNETTTSSNETNSTNTTSSSNSTHLTDAANSTSSTQGGGDWENVGSNNNSRVNSESQTPATRFYINSGDVLRSGQSLLSETGEAELRFDDRCNLYLIYNDNLVHSWLNSEGAARAPCELFVTKRGCLKMLSSNGKVNYLGKAGIRGAEYYQLVLTDLGRLRIFAVRRVWTNEPIDADFL